MNSINKGKKDQIINGKVLIVAVDIGSIRNTGYWRYSGGPESKVFFLAIRRKVLSYL